MKWNGGGIRFRSINTLERSMDITPTVIFSSIINYSDVSSSKYLNTACPSLSSFLYDDLVCLRKLEIERMI